ncbi:ketopantoate reductase family protein [Luteibacter jiangsuensis]|jgi:2-dehydropantoate 2-reductase
MKIAIVGPGAIGSTFAFQLSRAGHDVSVVARGARLARISLDRAIVLETGERAAVAVATELDPMIEFDLVLVTVLAPQVAAILPSLRRSRARKVMFMFNTFEAIDPLREAVGVERFAFGFPGGVFTLLKAGRIAPQIRRGTTVGDMASASLFSAAGIPTVVEADMQSWLRCHAAMVLPLMSIGVRSLARDGGISWQEAGQYTEALEAGMRIVRALGNDLRPGYIALLARLPRPVVTGLLWAMSRTRMIHELGELGAAEPRMLADMMSAAAPDLAAPIRAIRP